MNQDNNQNQWTDRGPRREDSSNNPYYNQPTHSPYRGEGFAFAAIIFSVLSVFCTSVFTVPLMFASTALIFAILANRKGRRRTPIQRTGMWLSCFSMVSAVVLIIQFFTTVLPAELSDPDKRAEWETTLDLTNTLLENTTGVSPDMTIDDVLNALGVESQQ